VSIGATQFYVYYRVRPADAAVLIAAVRALHAGFQATWPGLVCALGQQAEVGADTLTLMETYSHVDGLAQDRQHEIERLAQERLAPWLVGQRHSEAFVSCA